MGHNSPPVILPTVNLRRALVFQPAQRSPLGRIGLVAVGPRRDHGRIQARRVRRPLRLGAIVELRGGVPSGQQFGGDGEHYSAPGSPDAAISWLRLISVTSRSAGRRSNSPVRQGSPDAAARSLLSATSLSASALDMSKGVTAPSRPTSSNVTGPSATRTQRDRKSKPCS